MQLAINSDKLKCAGSAYLSIDQALKYLAEPKEEKPDQGDDSATFPESILAPGEYLYKRWDDTLEQWIWPYSEGKWHWVLLHCAGDEGLILSDDKPVDRMGKGASTYPGVVRRKDDDDLERAFFARSEFMVGRPEAMPNLDAKTAWNRLTYKDKEFWPAWRLIGQGMDVGRKLHTGQSGKLNEIAFCKWCDDHSLGDMSTKDKEHALYAADEWNFIFKLMERTAKKYEEAT